MGWAANMRLSGFLGGLVAASIALAGCVSGESGGSIEAASSGPPDVAADSSDSAEGAAVGGEAAADFDQHPCELLPSDDLAEILGAEVSEPDDFGDIRCVWTTADRVEITLTLARPDDPVQAVDESISTSDEAIAVDVGDRAFIVDRSEQSGFPAVDGSVATHGVRLNLNMAGVSDQAMAQAILELGVANVN